MADVVRRLGAVPVMDEALAELAVRSRRRTSRGRGRRRGHDRYVVREDGDSLAAAQPSDAVRLLPGHDQWVMGPGTKDVQVTPPDRREPVTRKANVVIAGGVVRGTWVRKDDELTVTWLDELPPPEAALAVETARLGGLLDRDLRLVLTSGRPAR